MERSTTFEIAEPTIIKLKPEWFKTGYYVYVVKMEYQGRKHYYVGMTGDRKHTTARSPFYRMSGHFSLIESSTQNQIIKGLRKCYPLVEVESILLNMDCTYYLWLIHEFDKNQHTEKREFTEKVESALMTLLKERFGGKNVFNGSLSTRDFELGMPVAAKILDSSVDELK